MNFRKESYPNKEFIIEEIEKYSIQLESNFHKEQYDAKRLNDKQNNASYIAVKDVQNTKHSKKILEAFFRNLGSQDDNLKHQGIYLFAEKKRNKIKFLYTGISRNAVTRLKEHIYKGDKDTASWAALIAKEENPKLATELQHFAYKKLSDDDKKIKAKLLNELKGEIENIQLHKISQYFLTFVSVDDNFLMHIAEGYIACKLKCYWNSFKTH